jgi:hypothetical protein
LLWAGPGDSAPRLVCRMRCPWLPISTGTLIPSVSSETLSLAEDGGLKDRPKAHINISSCAVNYAIIIYSMRSCNWHKRSKRYRPRSESGLAVFTQDWPVHAKIWHLKWKQEMKSDTRVPTYSVNLWSGV